MFLISHNRQNVFSKNKEQQKCEQEANIVNKSLKLTSLVF